NKPGTPGIYAPIIHESLFLEGMRQTLSDIAYTFGAGFQIRSQLMGGRYSTRISALCETGRFF
ncbi:hypothetical protein MJN54_21150, partial [Salmonella enterica subsp. enterica serovar Kentucky]|nr:hypothetical protein [Salmonella enterica subsp. enterica serovar Kentucky]